MGNVDSVTNYLGKHDMIKYINIEHTSSSLLACLNIKRYCDCYKELVYYFGLDVRKPVIGGLQITKVQTSLCIHAVWSVHFYSIFEKYHV